MHSVTKTMENKARLARTLALNEDTFCKFGDSLFAANYLTTLKNVKVALKFKS